MKRKLQSQGKGKGRASGKPTKRKAKAPAGPSSPSKCGDLSIQQRTSKHADLTTQQRRDIFCRWLNKKKSGETDEDLASAFDIARRTVVDVCGSIKAKVIALDGENLNFSGRVEDITVEAVMKLPDHHHVFQNNRKGNTGGARQSTKPRKARKPTKPSQEKVNGTLQWLQTLLDKREEDWCQNRKLPRDTLATLDKIHGLSLKQLRGTEEQLATDLGVELPTLRKFCFSHYASNLAQKRKEQQDLETKAVREEADKKRAVFQKKQGRIVASHTIAIPDHHPCITEVNRSNMPCVCGPTHKKGEWPTHRAGGCSAVVVCRGCGDFYQVKDKTICQNAEAICLEGVEQRRGYRRLLSTKTVVDWFNAEIESRCNGHSFVGVDIFALGREAEAAVFDRVWASREGRKPLPLVYHCSRCRASAPLFEFLDFLGGDVGQTTWAAVVLLDFIGEEDLGKVADALVEAANPSDVLGLALTNANLSYPLWNALLEKLDSSSRGSVRNIHVSVKMAMDVYHQQTKQIVSFLEKTNSEKMVTQLEAKLDKMTRCPLDWAKAQEALKKREGEREEWSLVVVEPAEEGGEEVLVREFAGRHRREEADGPQFGETNSVDVFPEATIEKCLRMLEAKKQNPTKSVAECLRLCEKERQAAGN